MVILWFPWGGNQRPVSCRYSVGTGPAPIAARTSRSNSRRVSKYGVDTSSSTASRSRGPSGVRTTVSPSLRTTSLFWSAHVSRDATRAIGAPATRAPSPSSTAGASSSLSSLMSAASGGLGFKLSKRAASDVVFLPCDDKANA
ncbi:hypothetical protein VNG_0357H [Halobacterium salinarum NRC-1]|uniref:Spurious ORF n=1 Tax=Halobacterium salinarum (strain ATCC 700922 / JCM 11081 / NRC-1) TaxID=64091 RepID=Q9HS85_HALSA|nr:hypothetical protein VNG_0357H [Halobacterium salinarum NRC-1]DAC77615.1 TPA_inf: spurious ORF [Halobacterium salinarum NRC-1]